MRTVVTVVARAGSKARFWLTASAALILAAGGLKSVKAVSQPVASGAPQTLQETGLYTDHENFRVDPRHLTFSPQYPLWTDGAAKRRWISLPPGTAIDGSDLHAWSFPAGTRFWKEFSFGGQRIETRYLERQPDRQWLYAAYAWSADGREARLAPQRGKRGAYQLGAGRSHTIPGVTDCKACHQGGRNEVLGFSALQLSPDRDPFALHAEDRLAPEADVESLIEKGLLVNYPRALQERPPRITASSATARTALGYMHGNCGHCHNEQGSLKNLRLYLQQGADASAQRAVTSTFDQPIRKLAPGQAPDAVLRIEPGKPERSGIVQRIASRDPALQMPPLGTELVDKEAVALIRRWITEADEIGRQTHREGR